MKQIIFAVENDSSMQELYRYALEKEFDCCCFDDGESFFDVLSEGSIPDLILLDIMLPVYDGFTILTRLKEDGATAHIPVVVVSAKGEEETKVKGLSIGADDYITKPLSVLELVARIKANLRKSGKESARNIVYKDISIDNTRHCITVKGVCIQTTLKEYNLLCFLCENANRVQEKEKIFNEVWGSGSDSGIKTLDFHIRKLRKKLSEARSDTFIQTIRGVGYIMTSVLE